MDRMILILISISGFLFLMGIIVLVYAVRGIYRKKIRIWKIPPYLASFLIFAALGAALIFLALFLQTFSRYIDEEHLGWVYAQKHDNSMYVSFYDLKADSLHQFTIKGDQWMIEGKILRWNLLLRFLGKSSMYKIVRFSGRWEREGEYSFYDMEGNAGLWEYIMKHYRDIPMIDAAYGIGAFQYAMEDTFDVYINDTGFILRMR